MDILQEISGLTTEEQAVMDHLLAAWAAFLALPNSDEPTDRQDFRAAIHDAQRVLSSRIVARQYPRFWV